MTIPFQPSERTQETAPIWWSQARLTPLRDSQRGATVADLLIVGAGLAGVATAVAVAQRRPDWKIVVAEANRVGAGATGSSTGIVGPGLSASLAALRSKYGDNVTRAAFAASVQGVAQLRELLESTGVRCDAKAGPHVLAALSSGQERALRKHAAAMAELGLSPVWLDREALDSRVGGGYRGGVRYDDVVLVDPYRLVTGLAHAGELLGVQVFERSPVQRLERLSQRVVAHLPAGTITASRVLLAVDGYAGGLNPHPSGVLPIRTHVLATEPLSATQLEELDWDGAGAVIDQRNYFNYYRLGAGRRLIFGGGPAHYPSGDPARDRRASSAVFQRLQDQLSRRFPSLGDVEVEARWSGLTGATLDRLPVVGPVHGDSRIHFIGGWCGHGLSLCLSTAVGYARVLSEPGAARAGHNGGEPALPWWRERVVGVPSRRLRSGALPVYLRALDWQDRLRSPRAASRPTSPRAQPAAARVTVASNLSERRAS